MRALIAIIALVVLGAMGIWGVQASIITAAEDTTVQNETFTPDAGNITTLEHSNQDHTWYSDNATVYDENGTLMDYGDDYLWYQSNGTLRAVSGGGLDGDTEGKVTYSYAQTTEEQRELAQIPSLIPTILAVLVMALPLVFLLKIVG